MNLLSENIKITRMADAGASGTTTLTSGVLDMAGYDGVTFLSGILTPNAGNYAKVSQSDASDGTGMADLAGSKVLPTGTVTATVVADVILPAKRYLQLSLVRGAATVTDPIYAIQYKGHGPFPLAIAAPEFAVKLKTPAEGTP